MGRADLDIEQLFMTGEGMDLVRIAKKLSIGSVRITDPDAFEKIAEIEGDKWANAEDPTGVESGSFHHALNQFTASQPVPPILGWGGYNRYYVDSSGEISFSSLNAMSKAHLEKAKAVGFKIK